MNINTEEKEILRQRFRDYISASVRSKECHDDIGIMVYPAIWDKYMGKKFPVKSVIEEIRTDSDYLADKPKSELPAIFFSVSGFNGSKVLQNVTEHTGLVVIDLDEDDNPNNDFNHLKDAFSRDRFVYACFSSPSGGLKIVFNTNLRDLKHHKVFYHDIVKHISTSYPEITKIDTSGSNANRACYMPYDKDVYFNPYSFKFCLSEQQITKIQEEIKTKKLYPDSLKPLLEVCDYSFEDHYYNIWNLLINQTSVGLGYKEKRTSIGIDNQDSVSESNSDSEKRTSVGIGSSSKGNAPNEKRTSVGLYDSVFNNYRYNNIIDYIMCTDVPFFETALWKHSYPYILDNETFLDENYFGDNTQEPICIENTKGFEDTDGIYFCEVRIPKDGIKIGYRHKTLASMSMKFIFNNPFIHPKRLVEYMQYLNHKHCLDPEPENNPKPSDEEVKTIVMHNYQKFISGELDFNKVFRKNDKTREVMKKYVFFSRKYVDICSSYTHLKAHNCFTKGRRDKNTHRYADAILRLQNGTKITYKRIAKELGISERHLLRIRSDEDYQEFFEIQKKLVNGYNVSLKKSNVDDEVLDLGSDILGNHKTILQRKDPVGVSNESSSLTAEQQQSVFDRIYSGILAKNGDERSEELFKLFQKELEELESEERAILNMKTDSISDADIFWKQGNLELKLLRLYDEVISANKLI